MSDENLLAQPPPPPEGAEEAKDIRDYLSADTGEFGLGEIGRIQAVGYFLPLLRELFHVNDARTKIVFAILYTLMTDDRVRWSRAELDEKLHWLKEGQRGYLLHRLSNVGWLEYFRDQGVYMISDKGEALMRILSRFTVGQELVDNEGAALAEIEFSMMLELDDLPDRLRFMRNRLVKHNLRAQTALESESAYRVLEVYQQLQSAYRWAEKTRCTLDEINMADSDAELWTVIRSVHSHLSTLHSQISQMQLVLQEIQRRQLDIAKYGLTHLDFDNYLINSTVEHLAEMMARNLVKVPHPFFLIEDLAFTEAAEILGRELAAADEEVRGWETTVTDVDPEANPMSAEATENFARELREAPAEWQPVTELLAGHGWEITAYRFQLLTVLADLPALRQAGNIAMDPVLDINLEAEFDRHGELTKMKAKKGERWTLTKGRYRLPADKRQPALEDSAHE